jgi:lipid-A-disaccharide synthase
MIIKIDFIGLANIVAGKALVPELIQHEASASRIAEEVTRYLTDDQYLKEVISGLKGVSNALGTPGAAARAAHAVLDFMEPKVR